MDENQGKANARAFDSPPALAHGAQTFEHARAGGSQAPALTPIPDSRLLPIGIDEAGRGPLAGPVCIAAVAFDPTQPRLNGLDDSKVLTAAKREALYERITQRALAWRVVFVEVEEIDRINILQATLAGMRRALEGVLADATLASIGARGCVARIDGNHLPQALPCAAEAWIDGDARDRSIMAASILAKVSRDRLMRQMHETWPQYGFDRHKGYASAAHLAALRQHGPCPQHRRSFAPIRQMSLL